MSNPAPRAPNELSIELLHEYQAKGANVLVPTALLKQVSPFFKVTIEQVIISPIPEDRDVWKLPGSAKYALSKQGLMKIAAAAGMRFGTCTYPNISANYVLAQATIHKRNTAGEWEPRSGTCEIDLEVVEQDLYLGLVDKMTKGRERGWDNIPKDDDECRAKAKAETMKIRRYKVARAETGAYLRAIKAMLPLKGEYAPGELGPRHPFIVPATHFSPDMENPMVRDLVVNSRALTLTQFWGDPGDMQKLEARTGKTHAELVQDQRAYHSILDPTEANEPPPELTAGVVEYGDEFEDDLPPAPVMPPRQDPPPVDPYDDEIPY